MFRVLQGMFLLEFEISWCSLFFVYKTLTIYLSGFLLLEEAQSEIVLFGKLTIEFVSSIWYCFFLQYAVNDHIEENQIHNNVLFYTPEVYFYGSHKLLPQSNRSTGREVNGCWYNVESVSWWIQGDNTF